MLYLQLLTLQNTLATPQAHCHPGSPASQSSDRQAAFCTQQTCEMTYHQSLIRISLHSSNISIHVYSVSVPMVCWLTMSAEVSQLTDQQNSSQHQCQLTTFRFLHYKLVSNQSLIRKLKSGFEPMLSEKSSF